jgi:hypothetical protein
MRDVNVPLRKSEALASIRFGRFLLGFFGVIYLLLAGFLLLRPATIFWRFRAFHPHTYSRHGLVSGFASSVVGLIGVTLWLIGVFFLVWLGIGLIRGRRAAVVGAIGAGMAIVWFLAG